MDIGLRDLPRTINTLRRSEVKGTSAIKGIHQVAVRSSRRGGGLHALCYARSTHGIRGN
jgi:hypothetical protein